MKRIVFNRILVLAMLIYSVFVFLPYFYGSLYSEEELNFLFYMPVNPLFEIPYWFGWIIYALSMFCYLSIYFGYTIVRYLYVAVLFFNVLFSALSGVAAYTGFEISVIVILSTIDGIILSFLFLKNKILVDYLAA